MRQLANDQQDRGERVRNSARNTFIYLSALFTVAQTVALSGFMQDKVSDEERKLIVFFGVSGRVGGDAGAVAPA